MPKSPNCAHSPRASRICEEPFVSKRITSGEIANACAIPRFASRVYSTARARSRQGAKRRLDSASTVRHVLDRARRQCHHCPSLQTLQRRVRGLWGVAACRPTTHIYVAPRAAGCLTVLGTPIDRNRSVENPPRAVRCWFGFGALKVTCWPAPWARD